MLKELEIRNTLANIKIDRVSGKDRYNTSNPLANNYFRNVDHLYLASGDNFADALYGGPLVSLEKTTLILVNKNHISNELKETLKSLNTKKVTILGGENSISTNVEIELKDINISTSRIAGKDRFETAKLINEIKFKHLFDVSMDENNISLSNGYIFADSLCASPFVYYNDKFNLTYFLPYSRFNSIHGAKYVFGGENSVPKMYIQNERFAGKDRYETSIQIANATKKLLPNGVKTVVIASGTDFPDSLSASSVTTNLEGVLLISEKDKLRDDIKQFIKENKSIQNVIIVGGENSISSNVEKELKEIK